MDPKLLLVIMIFGGCLCGKPTKPQPYYFEVHTSHEKNAGSTGPINVAVEGAIGKTDFGPIWTDLGKGSVKNFTALGSPTGLISCIELTMLTPDNWMPNKVVVQSEDNKGIHTKRYFYSNYIWMSSDPSKGVLTQEICKQGDTVYAIAVTTSTMKGADADHIWPSVIIKGTKGETETGILVNQNHDDYEKGVTDIYTFPGMKDVGQISCIQVVVRGNGDWLFDTMVVQRENQDPVTFNNADEVFVSKTGENTFCL